MRRGKHPTGSRRKRRQRIKERLARALHDAQLADVIPIEPEGVLRDERVPACAQDPPTDHLGLVAVAARAGWATPEEAKPRIVDNLVDIATGTAGETVVGESGAVISTGPSLKTQVYAAKVLTEIDQIQYERDNPEAAGRAKGGVKVGVGVNVTGGSVFGDIDRLITRARERRDDQRDEVVDAVATRESGSSAGKVEDAGPQDTRTEAGPAVD